MSKNLKKDEAKILFFKYRTPDEIAKELEISIYTVQRWVWGRFSGDPNAWSLERQAANKQFIRDAGEQNARSAHGVVRLGFRLVQDSLISRAKWKDKEGNTIPLSIKEAESVTKIITDVDKLMRLAAGEPTEIFEEKGAKSSDLKPITIEELRKAIAGDPFISLDAVIPMKKREQNESTGVQDSTSKHGEGIDNDPGAETLGDGEEDALPD